MARAATVVIFALFVPSVWYSYSRLMSNILNADGRRFANSDAWSYSPLILTALMLIRFQWPVQRLGAILLISAAAMSIWIKAGQLIAVRKGLDGAGKWTYAAPAGFACAVVLQAAYSRFDWAMYLVTGQLFALAMGAVAGAIKRAAR